MTKKLFVKTYGCQMNVYDSERMAEIMGEQGFRATETPEDADMILLNTCHIREKAAEKVYSELGRYRNLKAQNPKLVIGVAGCVAQAEGEEILRRQSLVDIVVGPQSYHRLPELTRQVESGKKAVDTDFPWESKFAELPQRQALKKDPAAFLTVQEGCDKFCSFCVVPYTRGAEASRPVPEVVREAQTLVEHGVRDITLLGQNVNTYHGKNHDGKDWSLAKLIWELSKINGLERIRFTTSHPIDMTDDLIAAHGECEKLMPYLHLPVQAGSDQVLKRMGRKHTVNAYRKIIEKLRRARPDIALSGDFIVGFPEETDADFEATLELVREIQYSHAYSFKYSPRPGTPAATRKQVPEAIKTERLQRLQELLTEQQQDAQQAMVGEVVTVLMERTGRKPKQMVGKSEYRHTVHVENCTMQIGDMAEIKILAATANSLAGAIAA
ncbi:MAG: tRNA (N6-isopentenyl adenosine(37)-C2)-methylthiotransferase MiaB [Aestuariivita sp.]|nr:tRNA (N6-isopentenyl adenosine(37)-C2)-methylthiotransferase MiaB [Aestuariivita sp.]MCY4346830.1 tRNA (N6-isopentenyl adenosine(37)-C2)-methylthiotransferase MiaB [Aestuariivita sp.]